MASGDSGPSGARRPARRPGRRPLDRAKDEAITAAVVEGLARLGFSGFTMDEVALAAGVGKAAIYRRWAGKTELLASYTEGSIKGTLDVSDTGSLRNDLVEWRPPGWCTTARVSTGPCSVRCTTTRCWRRPITPGR